MVSIIAGAFGGVVKLYSSASMVTVCLLQRIGINSEIFGRIVEAGAAALACGFLGALGKHLFTLLMRKITKFKNHKK